ncbi:hypothetical protein J5N97_008684 [Dioscorea zingiberensis]|uniref:Coenzyme Q-binding protein COQ10 START domain-containing protein n=1 Tax=Dioscorea zingiberensis TaxID=325984 RepID=A0A9D5CWX7_9LILI|nr:hypothetical protein J5N97_008684 [Dioscorea zingiberensis]
MASSKLLPLLLLILPLSYAATFEIVNQCPYTVWAAAVPAGRGTQLNSGQTWTINVNAGTTGGHVWGRTGCKFDASGHGSCQTGDCGGLLACQAYGNPPNTLAEFALNQEYNLDYNYISLLDGFNVPMDFSPTGGCMRGARCSADINGQCPAQLKASGGCNNPCTVFKTDNSTATLRSTRRASSPRAKRGEAEVNSTLRISCLLLDGPTEDDILASSGLDAVVFMRIFTFRLSSSLVPVLALIFVLDDDHPAFVFPEQMFAVVSVVDLYEDFLPWCQRSKIIRCNSDGSFDAELEIGFKFLVESYVSHVELQKSKYIKVHHVWSYSLGLHNWRIIIRSFKRVCTDEGLQGYDEQVKLQNTEDMMKRLRG